MESTRESSVLPPLIIKDVPDAFLELCKPSVEVPAQFESSLSSGPTLVSLAASDSDKQVDQTPLIKNYIDAYTDTYGLHSGRGFIFKTGPAWPKREDPNARPFRRELRSVNSHRITPVWDNILTDIEVYLKEAKLQFTAVMPLGFANVGEERAFCPLVVVIGVEPKKVAFEDAKAVAESIKVNILTKADFTDIEVALWEFEMFLSGSGPKLPALDPELHGNFSEYHHPFTSTLGIAVAPLKQPWFEGSLGLFFTHGEGSEILALTTAHVARPPALFPDNKGLSLKAADRYHEEMVVLGSAAYTLAIKNIQTKAGSLIQDIKMDKLRIQGLQRRLDNGVVDANGNIATAIRMAKQNVEISKDSISQLNNLHSRVTQFMPIPDNRCIGRVLFADPIGASSDSSDAYNQDWAIIGIRKDAFGRDFQGNTLYIGDKLNEQTFLDHMFPHFADCENYIYPGHGKLCIRGVVPWDEIIHPKQRDAKGDPAMAVIKNGRTSGTTVGWVGSLKALVRHDKFGIEYTTREITIIPYDNKPARGTFSDEGDSGSIIVDRSGRVLALLTAGGGSTDSTDVTFATPYCELEKRIKEVFPGIRLL